MKFIKGYLFSLFVPMLLLMSSCGAPAVTPQTFPEIIYGEDVCEHCGMIISDERFAAGVVIQTQPNHYEHRIFDDIGDMFTYAQTLQAQTLQEGDDSVSIVTYFVHDYQSREWMEASQAHFVRAESSLTPMGSGLVAFASQEEAEAHAQEWQGVTLTFDAARQQTTAQHGHAQH